MPPRALAALVVTVALATAPLCGVAAERIVEATGEADFTVAADQAVLTLGVTSEAPAAKQALEENARTMTAVIAALAQAGFAAPDVSTRAVSLTPVTDYRPNTEPRIVGYRASNTVQVKTRDPASIGRALDAGVQAGANVAGGIAFGLADPRGAEAYALRLATQDAHARARVMAEALGKRLGDVLEIRAIELDRPAPRLETLQARAAATPTPIEPGVITIRARAVLKAQLR